jgi:hypothetical protein
MDQFEFKTAATGIDRSEALQTVARAIEVGQSYLSDGDRKAALAEAERTRALASDIARLPAQPEWYRITESDFQARGKPAPVSLAAFLKDHDFYWLGVSLHLMAARDWAFNMIELKIDFLPDAAGRLARVHSVLPAKAFQELVNADMSFEVGLDESAEFKAAQDLAAGPAKGSVGVGGVLKGKVGAVFGPFKYRIRRAHVDHTGAGNESIGWRIRDTRFAEDERVEFVVVARVPKAASGVTARAELQAYRYFNTGAASFQSAVHNLIPALREYFLGGMPLHDAAEWPLAAGAAD